MAVPLIVTLAALALVPQPMGRRDLIISGFGAIASLPYSASAVSLQSLSSRPSWDDAKDGVYPILAAQQDVKRLLADEETYRTMVKIGLPTDNLKMPPQLSFSLFRKLESSVSDPGEFMDAAIEYVEYSRDGNDLVELARMARFNGAGPLAIEDYVQRSIVAARGCAKALDRMVPLLPASQ